MFVAYHTLRAGPASPALGTARYLDPANVTGNAADANPGSASGLPWATMAHAVASATPGTTVLVYPCTMVGNNFAISCNGTSEAGRIRFKSLNPFAWVVDGTGQAAGTTGMQITGNYVTVEGIQIQNAQNTGILMAGDSWQLLNARVTGCGFNGGQLPHFTAGVLVGALGTNGLVQGCEMWGNGGHCVYLGNDVNGCMVRYNLLHDNGTPSSDLTTGGAGDGIQINGKTVSALIEGNRIYNNYGKGISVIGGNVNQQRTSVILRNNALWMDGAWIYQQPFGTGAAGYLIVADNTAGALQLYNNTLFILAGTYGVTPKCISLATGITNWTALNNLLVNLATGNAAQCVQFADATPPAGHVWDYNDYLTAGGVGGHIVELSGTSTLASLATWQGTYGQDAHGLNVDPKFAGTAAGGNAYDLHLTGATPSTVRQGGKNLSAIGGFLNDLAQALRADPWGMGCYV